MDGFKVLADVKPFVNNDDLPGGALETIA